MIHLCIFTIFKRYRIERELIWIANWWNLKFKTQIQKWSYILQSYLFVGASFSLKSSVNSYLNIISQENTAIWNEKKCSIRHFVICLYLSGSHKAAYVGKLSTYSFQPTISLIVVVRLKLFILMSVRNFELYIDVKDFPAVNYQRYRWLKMDYVLTWATLRLGGRYM